MIIVMMITIVMIGPEQLLAQPDDVHLSARAAAELSPAILN